MAAASRAWRAADATAVGGATPPARAAAARGGWRIDLALELSLDLGLDLDLGRSLDLAVEAPLELRCVRLVRLCVQNRKKVT